MITVIIKDNGEKNVVQLTYENIFKELKDVSGSELIVKNSWIDNLHDIKNRYVCFLEPDCLVSSGYFSSQLGLLEKNPFFRKIAMMTSATGVNDWANKFYGYSADSVWSDKSESGIQTKNNYIKPNKDKKSNTVYPVQIGYVPGAVIQLNMLHKALGTLKTTDGLEDNLVSLSTQLSLAFWGQGVGNGVGNRVHINPNSTYVTTEDYVNDLSPLVSQMGRLMDMFRNQAI